MAFVASIGTYLPCWGSRVRRVPGDDEDALTLAVEAGRAALADRAGARRVVLVSRDLPLLEGGNAAVLLAGLGLDADIEVSEILGGAPAVLDAVSSARPHTLVIGADTGSTGATGGAGAAAVLAGGGLFAADQASVTGVEVGQGAAAVHRNEPAPRLVPEATRTAGADIPISLAAYDRAFAAKTRWEAGRHPGRDELDFPPRYRVGQDGSLRGDYTLVPLPRTGTVYTGVTVHVPVPGLTTPYSLVIVELDDVGVRALVKVTGATPGTVRIGDRGLVVMRRVALRSGVPDYGYAFCPDDAFRRDHGERKAS